MNKNDLARSLAQRHQFTHKQSIQVIDDLLSDVTDALLVGDQVGIPGFGRFVVRDRAARMMRNPRTGEPVSVPAKRVFKFLPAKALKDAILAKGKSTKKKGPKAAASKKTAPKKPAPKKPAPKKSSSRKAVRKTK